MDISLKADATNFIDAPIAIITPMLLAIPAQPDSFEVAGAVGISATALAPFTPLTADNPFNAAVKDFIAVTALAAPLYTANPFWKAIDPALNASIAIAAALSAPTT